MSPKIHPVKIFLGRDGLRPGFKTGIRGQVSVINSLLTTVNH
jgi:hypothetical protein